MRNSKAKILPLIACVFASTALAACGGNSEKPSDVSNISTGGAVDINKEITDPIDVLDGYKRYDIGERAQSPIVGFGAQMDTDIFMPWNRMTPEDEAIWEQRIREMNLKYTRIKFFPEFFERGNDNDDPNSFDFESKDVDFESVEMKALYKILDLCEKYDIKVDLSWYGCYNWFESYDGKYTGSWLANPGTGWVSGPKDYDEYAENIAACLEYLFNVKHYTCIWGVTHIFEMFTNEVGVHKWEDFVECSKIIDAKLKKEGLRDKVKLFSDTGVSTGGKQGYLENFATVKDIFDVCGVGNYNWDYTAPNEAMYNYFTEMMEACHESGKNDYVISEFCQGKHFLDAVNKTDIDDYSAGLYIARFCIEASKAGVTGFDHYILGDTFFTNAYIHTMGLWMYRDSNLTNPDYISWAAHPEFYFYSMMCRYTDTGAYAYKFNQELMNEYDMEDPDVNLVAFKMANGKWTYFITNKGSKNKKVALVNPLAGRPGEMKCYKVTPSAIPEDRNCDLIESYQTVDGTEGVVYITVPANGLVTISDKY